MSDRNVIFFDFDGVIVSTFDAALEINRRWRTDLTAEEYRKQFEGNINNGSVKAPGDAFFRLFTPRLLQQSPVPGMDHVVRSLAARSDLAIISSTITSAIRAFLMHVRLDSFFFEILGNDVATSKTEKMKRILTQRSLNPAHCLMITDTLGDIREAREAGVSAIAVTWGYHDRTTLQKGSPFAIVEHPAELEGEVGRFFTQ